MTRGRKPGFKMPEEHRHKIKIANILSALQQHIEGKKDMSSTQVTAAIALMRKVLPDLTATDLNANVTHNYVAHMPAKVSGDEWRKLYSPSLSGNQDPSPSKH